MRPLQFTLARLLVVVLVTGTGVGILLADPFRQTVRKSDRPLDLAIVGEGYFSFSDSDGRPLISRRGRLTVKEGYLGATFGDRQVSVDPPICVPEDFTEFRVGAHGHVEGRSSHPDDVWTCIGALLLAETANSKLVVLGNGLYTVECGGLPISSPGVNDLGTVRSGFVETERPFRWTAIFWLAAITALILVLPRRTRPERAS